MSIKRSGVRGSSRTTDASSTSSRALNNSDFSSGQDGSTLETVKIFGIAVYEGPVHIENDIAATRSKLFQEAALSEQKGETYKTMLVIANNQGSSVLGDLRNLTTQVENQTTKIENLTTKIENLTTQVENWASETRRMDNFYRSYSGHGSDIRRRFLAVYERDVKNIRTYSNRNAIVGGNDSAHKGDAYADALLFESSEPPNEATYIELYGVSYDLILKHNRETDGDLTLFQPLNIHASLLSNANKPTESTWPRRQLSLELKTAFDAYVAAIKYQPFQVPKEQRETPLYSTWAAFILLDCKENLAHNGQVGG